MKLKLMIKASPSPDILANTYFGVDEEIIWDIIQNKTLQLKEKIDRKRMIN